MKNINGFTPTQEFKFFANIDEIPNRIETKDIGNWDAVLPSDSMVAKGITFCLPWKGTIGRNGWGIFHFGARGHIRIQRAAWIIYRLGDIPDGFNVAPICGNKLCVAESHLRLFVKGSSILSRKERLERLSKRSGIGECVNFTGSVDKHGYGKFDKTLAHRAAWEINRGPIPPGLFVLHQCDNPSCVNVNHLFLGTQGDNVKDMMKKGRQRFIGAPKGHIGAGRKISSEQALLVRSAYSSGEVTMHQIALVLGVHESVISRLVNARQYAQI
jgi:hypothetical protein